MVNISHPHVALCLERAIVMPTSKYKARPCFTTEVHQPRYETGQELYSSTQTSRFKASSSCRLGSWLYPWTKGFKKELECVCVCVFQHIYLAGCYDFKMIVFLWYTSYVTYNTWISSVPTLPSGRSLTASITDYTNSSLQTSVRQNSARD